jgi:hypothetical protein
VIRTGHLVLLLDRQGARLFSLATPSRDGALDHHMELPWTDTNFGNVFSFWDRLMGTMVHGDPLQVRYGVDTLEGSPDESIVYQLKVPMHGRRM